MAEEVGGWGQQRPKELAPTALLGPVHLPHFISGPTVYSTSSIVLWKVGNNSLINFPSKVLRI